jgi:NAD(P)-dependent dehydrogenase (short-subunit alcohol dehydrogenase family)
MNIIEKSINEIKNKSVIVTGGARGIGKEVVIELSKLDLKVSIVDISEYDGYMLAKQPIIIVM